MCTRVILLCICGILLAGGLAAQEIDRLVDPEGVFYYQPAASVFGAEAAWINPAALGRYRTASFQVMGDYYDGNIVRSYGYVVGRDQLTVAYRYLDRPDEGIFKEWVYAAGVPIPVGADIGFSYRTFAKGPSYYDDVHTWNLGLGGKSGTAIRWAAVFSNLNRHKIDGRRTETEMRYSLAYRPFGPKSTFAVDMFLSTGTRLSNAHYIYHAELNPSTGLYLYGSIDSDNNIQVGVRANLLQYFTAFRSRFNDDGDGRGTTLIVGATGKKQPSIVRQPARRLAMNISGRPAENPVQPLLGRRSDAFVTLLAGIYRAADDPTISEMMLDLTSLRVGFAQAQELRDALKRFSASGKQITAYLRSPGNVSYYVASVADRILIPPVSRLNLVGLRAELTFYGSTLEKVGANIELLRIGDHKTATERYTRSESSPANREQVNRLLDYLYAGLVNGIAEGRSMSRDSVMALIDLGPFTSADALAAGLVDGLAYRDAVASDYLTSVPQISFRRYVNDTLINDDWRPRPKLAVVVAEGEIASRPDNLPFMPQGGVTPGKMRGAFRQAVNDPSIAGIVFRVNSPGGEALAGEDIYHSASLAAEKKPMVVSMGNVAASGAYYSSMASQRIFASPGTVTGSIGIYGGKPDLSGLYEKLKIGKELYTRGRFAGMLTNMRPFSDEERAKYFSQLKAFYDHFISLVGENRSLPVDSIDALGQGRVWTGEEALENGLVDEIGGLKASLDYMAGMLGLDTYDIEILPSRRPLFVLPGRSLLGPLLSLFARNSDSIGDPIESLLPGEEATLLARMPYDLYVE